MKYLFVIVCCIYWVNLKSQDFQTYRLYTIDEFVKNHFQDSQTFYHAFYSAIKYPAIARENHWEGVIDIMLINHSDTSFEISVTNDKGHLFYDNIYQTLLWSRKVWQHTNIPFIVQFCIEYKLDVFPRAKSDSNTACSLHLTSLSIPGWRDTSYIYSENEVSYLPQIAGYPNFIYNQAHYQPLESIEDLMEIIVKSCCNKSLHLTHLETRKSYHYGRYIETQDVIAVIINRKGFISKVGVYGKLVKKIDLETLSIALKKLRFRPALANDKPVNVTLSFRVE